MLPNPGATPSPYQNTPQSPTEPAFDFLVVAPHDTNNFATRPRGIYVGGAGDVVMINNNGDPITFKAVPAGTLLPVSPRRINNTNTTATLMIALI